MKNRKLFIGNLSFEATEEEIKELLSQHGTVVKIKLYRKKGYALAEMSEVIEAQNAVENLEGSIHRERKIRVSPEVRSGPAKAMTIKRYQQLSETIAREKAEKNTTKIKSESKENSESTNTYKPK